VVEGHSSLFLIVDLRFGSSPVFGDDGTPDSPPIKVGSILQSFQPAAPGPAHKVFHQRFFAATVNVCEMHSKGIMGTERLISSLGFSVKAKAFFNG